MSNLQGRAGWQCPQCGLQRATDGGPDPCLGMLPGVIFACCGHGGKGDGFPYIGFENGVRIGMRMDGIVSIERDGKKFDIQAGLDGWEQYCEAIVRALQELPGEMLERFPFKWTIS